MNKRLGSLVLLFLTGFAAKSQDLNARVQIISTQIQNSNKTTFDALGTVIRDFLNNRKWSQDVIQAHERIDCSFVINITQWDGSSAFQADAQILSSRPVFGSSYNTTVLSITDKDFSFSYADGQPLDFSDQNFISNLSSLLAFYAYTIVGMDYDTFSKSGGTPYFVKAQAVVNNAQNVSFVGWKAFENLKNRYWIAENLNNKAFAPLRETLYDYHRGGLDVLAANQQKGRKGVLSSLSLLQKLDKQKQGSVLNQVFFTAKSDEIVSILGGADPTERAKAYLLLAGLDPANSGKYEALKK